MTNPPLWKASVKLPKADAHDAAAVFDLTPPTPQAVLIAEEPFKDDATVEALYAEEVDGEFLSRLMGRTVTVAPLPDQDWIKRPRKAFRRCGPGVSSCMARMMPGQVPHGVIPLKIEAGLAFGTGHHETTALCLAALSDLAKSRAFCQCARSGLRHRSAGDRRGQTVAQACAGLRHRSWRRSR